VGSGRPCRPRPAVICPDPAVPATVGDVSVVVRPLHHVALPVRAERAPRAGRNNTARASRSK
jgi:hypothetical protein